MNKSEFAIVIILRFVGITGLFAIPAIFLPFSWMDAAHNYLGLGDLPSDPIVSYLARSLSAFYAAVSAITLFISYDLQRYRSLVKLWAMIVVFLGVVLLGVDIEAGLPTFWTIGEGPPTILVGIVVLWLQRRIGIAAE